MSNIKNNLKAYTEYLRKVSRPDPKLWKEEKKDNTNQGRHIVSQNIFYSSIAISHDSLEILNQLRVESLDPKRPRGSSFFPTRDELALEIGRYMFDHGFVEFVEPLLEDHDFVFRFIAKVYRENSF